MAEEIKEILNNDIPIFVIDSDGYTINITETIQNVITNLQQENKAKTHQIEVLEEIVNYERNIRNDKLQQENENTKKLKERYQLEKEIYKSRCEKAIYYIWKEIEQEYDEENDKWLKEKIDNLSNILNGSDENE